MKFSFLTNPERKSTYQVNKLPNLNPSLGIYIAMHCKKEHKFLKSINLIKNLRNIQEIWTNCNQIAAIGPLSFKGKSKSSSKNTLLYYFFKDLQNWGKRGATLSFSPEKAVNSVVQHTAKKSVILKRSSSSGLSERDILESSYILAPLLTITEWLQRVKKVNLTF